MPGACHLVPVVVCPACRHRRTTEPSQVHRGPSASTFLIPTPRICGKASETKGGECVSKYSLVCSWTRGQDPKWVMTSFLVSSRRGNWYFFNESGCSARSENCSRPLWTGNRSPPEETVVCSLKAAVRPLVVEPPHCMTFENAHAQATYLWVFFLPLCPCSFPTCLALWAQPSCRWWSAPTPPLLSPSLEWR